MIKEYFLRTRQELMEQKIDATAQGKKIGMEIEEINEFISVIESSQDKSYEAFFPQNTSAISDSEKIKELKANRKNLEEAAKKIQLQIASLSEKITELDQLLHLQKQSEIERDAMKQQLEKDLQLKENLIQGSVEKRMEFQQFLQSVLMGSVNEISKKIGFCIKLADMDPKRCWLELQIASKTIQKMTYDLKDVSYQIYPFLKNNLGFSIQYYIDYFQKKNEIQIDYRTNDPEYHLPDQICVAVIYAIKELCDPVRKIEDPSVIDLELNCRSQELVIRTKMVGCGFRREQDDVEYTAGHSWDEGMLSLRNMLELYSGRMNIKERNDGTTRTEIVIPWKATEE